MDVNLTQGLHRAVQQKPNGIATIFGERKRTFTELRDRVAKLAGALRRLGVKADQRVGMLALNSDRYLEYYLAVPWAGASVNPCNVRWSVQEIVYSLDDCDTHVLLIDDAFLKMADALKASKSVKTFIYVGDGETPAGMLSYEQLITDATPIPDAMRGGEDVYGIFYTGGTTGAPKGVILTHSNVYASAIALAADLQRTEAPVYMHAAPMFHMADTAGGMTFVLLGATHAFVPSFTPKGMLETIEKAKVTATLLVPTIIQLAVDSPESGKYDTSSLTSVLYGASPISEAVLKRAMAAWPTAKFTQAYGMTELSPVATTLTADYHVTEGAKAGRLRAAGRASLGTDVRIWDSNDQEVPRGTVGEVCVRGPNVMKGYWNKPELTKEALRNGYMHTGDGGYMDDEGFVFIVDRIKDMIITGGENVYSGEVENALMQHPSVAMCAVIAVPDEKWGERVHAVVVCKAGQSLTEVDVSTHVKSLIAAYKTPRSIEFRTELPISGAGKILKAQIREPFWKGVERKVGG